MKNLALILATLSTLVLVGCHGGSHSGGGGTYTPAPTKLELAEDFVDNLTFDPEALDYFLLEKTYTYQGGGWIVRHGDAHQSDFIK